jgi:hypothetical protein
MILVLDLSPVKDLLPVEVEVEVEDVMLIILL